MIGTRQGIDAPAPPDPAPAPAGLQPPPYRLLSDTHPDALRTAARAAYPDAPAVSRSYREPYALVAAHAMRVGVDIERVDAPSAQTRPFGLSVATLDERVEFADRFDDPEFVASLWSSKEALAKALGDAVRYEPRRLQSPITWPGGAAGRWRAVPLPALPPRHVGWLVWEQ